VSWSRIWKTEGLGDAPLDDARLDDARFNGLLSAHTRLMRRSHALLDGFFAGHSRICNVRWKRQGAPDS
jgi:hypothetical protein